MTSEGEIVVELLSQLCLLDLEENFIEKSQETILTKVQILNFLVASKDAIVFEIFALHVASFSGTHIAFD